MSVTQSLAHPWSPPAPVGRPGGPSGDDAAAASGHPGLPAHEAGPAQGAWGQMSDMDMDKYVHKGVRVCTHTYRDVHALKGVSRRGVESSTEERGGPYPVRITAQGWGDRMAPFIPLRPPPPFLPQSLDRKYGAGAEGSTEGRTEGHSWDAQENPPDPHCREARCPRLYNVILWRNNRECFD